MQNFEKNRGEAAAAISTSITFFKPRQVLLKSKSIMKCDKDNGSSLSVEQRLLLLQSISQFLEQSGFSKSLKKFRKEADIEKESWKSCSLNLEEMCCHYLKMRNDAKASDCAIKEQGSNQHDEGDEGKKSLEKMESHLDDVKSTKKKKKDKSGNEFYDQVAEETRSKPSKEPEDAFLSVPSEPEKKSKDKKKKKHKDAPLKEKKEETGELSAGEVLEKPNSVPQQDKEMSESMKKKDDTINTEDLSAENTEVDKGKKGSKKRKKSASEENGTVCVEKEVFDDAKRRKTDNVDQSNGTILPKTPNGSANGVLEKDGKVSKKDKTKLGNGSAEPRTAANAFRRVKEEEVEFVDDRLQDNSYWAKHGAESGYGAKAQEVLGQVRGRDFRHEKTKKKRGSYRGGQIDLDSHSIKFNYDDDE